MDLSLSLLSAPSGAGKTTFCLRRAEQARAAGWQVSGILCPPVFQGGVKTGILVQDLRSGETRPLAVSSLSQTELSTFNLPLGQWLFDSSALAWGNEVLAAALPCDLLIVDELGPLELMRGEGWQNAISVLRQPRYKIGLAVVRPSLLQTAQTLFPQAKILPLPAGE